jgi:zinc protease
LRISGKIALIALHEQLGRTMLYDEQMEAKIQTLTLAQVNTVFREYMDPAQVTIVKAGDFKKVGVYQ